ncbi:MAG: glycosyltransferase family 2 protein [Clostridia bacterium]|nr:glycosyltransferase family 2 protein [Clostridia bacterium]
MLLTIFTPTYNREHLLPRLYHSLLEQTCRDFCWLIVDDGSLDHTRELVEQWQHEGNLKITYIYQSNGGKMRAHNTGVRHADTELFLCVDSDDYLSKTAVDVVIEKWCREKDDNKSGIVAHKGKSENELLSGMPFPLSGSSTLYGLYLHGFQGETTLVFRTKILKENLFPEIEGEKYVPEDYIYDKIDRNYQLLILPEILTICEIVEAGYTANVRKLREDNPHAWYLYYKQRAEITPFSILKLKYVSYYWIYAGFVSEKIFKNTELSSVMILAGLPGALVLKILNKR